ncbi:hypothetical protein N431DRAFT_449982 [Stipitochalara longipes BDJ]|nr:hypothetical protein N431DRAFT_449982 [Stipitochalara longipes BDJ]
MASPLPPKIQTYHCLCTSLLLATTHTLSSLPRRSTTNSPSSSSDLILPLPSSPPILSPSSQDADLREEGYSMLLGVVQDKKTTIVRREDGFEKRLCWRCERCGVVFGYELQGQGVGREEGEAMEGEKGKGREDGVGYKGKVVYLVPGAMQSTDVMMGRTGGRKIGESDVGAKGIAVFE